MAVDERNRPQLAEAAKRVLGDDEGITLTELLPPVGWADVATKQDLAVLETWIDARIDRVEARFDVFDHKLDALEHEIDTTLHRELRSQTWKLFALVAAAMSAMVGALVALARF